MKKRATILLVLIVLMMMCSLTACTPEYTTPLSSDVAATELSSFKNIEGKESLVYSIDTRVVYYMFRTQATAGYAGYGYTYFAPYISENGRFCRYVDDEIVEIIVDANN